MRSGPVALFAVAALAITGGAVLLTANSGGTAAAADQPPIIIAQAETMPVVDPTGTFTPDQMVVLNQLIGDYIAANDGFIRDYLLENPEVLQEAVTELERRRVVAEAEAQSQAITDYRELIYDSPRQVVLGNPDGDVTLVEFFDYNCTYCKRALDDMLRLIEEDPDLRVVLKEYPILSVASVEAAQVAAGVNVLAPESYAEFHTLLLGTSAQATESLAFAAAAEVGLSEEELRVAMANPEAGATLEEASMLGNALGMTGTPSYVLGDEVIVGAVGYEALRTMIQSVRACGSTSCL